MQLFARPIECGGGSQAIRDHRGFVKNRDLHENMRQIGIANHGCRKRLAEQLAGRLLKNIDANESEKAAANKQQPSEAATKPVSHKIRNRSTKTNSHAPVPRPLPVRCARAFAMRLFAWNGRFARTVLRAAAPLSCRQPERLIQAAGTDTSQALNSNSLVLTTNKLQQFVAEFERLDCLTSRPRGGASGGHGRT